MKVLIACEESQAVCVAMRNLGVEAFSCDILPASGGHPEWHIQGDVLDVLHQDWSAVIAFPPCTHLSRSGGRYWKEKQADGRQQEALDFFMKFVGCAPVWAIENPIGRVSTYWRKPDQIIHPWQFGHGETKKTCLWLGGLPNLTPTHIIPEAERKNSLWRLPPSPERSRLRSKTFTGIAEAMSNQWLPYLI